MTTNVDDLSLALYEDDPDAIKEMRRRQEEAELHEKKLKIIQETVPTRTFNVCGSSAGAGSGDFHQYRMIRRRENARLKRMNADALEEETRLYREQRLTVLKKSEERRTAKNRNKRMKEKIRKKSKKKETRVLDPSLLEDRIQETNTIEAEIPEQVALD